MLRSQSLDAEGVKADFPILKKKVHGKRLVYLDNAATTQKPRSVVDAVSGYYTKHNANPHRGVHQLSIEATEVFDESRRKVMRFINAARFEEVVFTSGATDSLNLVRYGWGSKHIKGDDLIVLTIMEHHSNIVPWQLLAAEKGARIEFVGITKEGELDEGRFEELMAESPALVAFTHCSNVLGTINDAKKLCSSAKRAGATTVVDAAQSVPHMKTDVQDIDCDFLAFSGHKMLAPMGIGIVYGRREKLAEAQPYRSGGDMIKEVHTSGATWNDLPYKFEAGTQNVEGAVGLGAAIDYLEALGMDRVRQHEEDLLDYALQKLEGAPGITVYGPKRPSDGAGVISFNLGDIHPHDIASILDEEGVAVRSGHHCAQPLIEELGITAATRASFYVYNSREDVDELMNALAKARRIFCI
ncbi:MAG: cysteine desulfurase [Nitrososphaerota archaeon]|nr:cysteine desulfurase [Nitrososphaerota archaeon]